jgi:ATP-dependent Clp protease ATP-binding subunit ClpA
MFERFTDRAREAVVQAQGEARLLRHDYIGTEHLLLGILREGTSVGARILDRLGVDLETVRGDVVRIVGEGLSDGYDKDAEALRAIGIDVDEIRRRVEEAFGLGALDRRIPTRGRRRRRAQCGPIADALIVGHIPFTPRAKKALELSLREALVLGHRYIGTEHMLLGLVREGEGIAASVLSERGATPQRVRNLVSRAIEGGRGEPGRSA